MLDKIENVTSTLGVLVGIQQIESILGIILLVVNLSIILYKCGYKIYTSIKEKKYGDVIEHLEDAKEEIEDLKDKSKGGDK